MKKTYIAPDLLVQCAEIEEYLMAGSLLKNETTVSGGNGGWTKENSGDWSDIWSAPAADAGVNP